MPLTLVPGGRVGAAPLRSPIALTVMVRGTGMVVGERAQRVLLTGVLIVDGDVVPVRPAWLARPPVHDTLWSVQPAGIR